MVVGQQGDLQIDLVDQERITLTASYPVIFAAHVLHWTSFFIKVNKSRRTANRRTLWWLMESGLEYLITAFTDVIFAYFSIWLFRNEEIRGSFRRFVFSALVQYVEFKKCGYVVLFFGFYGIICNGRWFIEVIKRKATKAHLLLSFLTKRGLKTLFSAIHGSNPIE